MKHSMYNESNDLVLTACNKTMTMFMCTTPYGNDAY